MKHIPNISKIGRVINIVILTSLLTFAVSCTEKFDERNTPQNQIVVDKIDANLLGQAFAASQYRTLAGMSTSYIWSSVLYSDRFAQYHSNIHPAFQSDQFVDAGAHLDRVWTDFYSLVATQLDFVDKFTAEKNMKLENALTKIWRVEAYHRLTDHFGPIIYSEFGNAKTSVKFDAQKDIYLDFFKILDDALVVLKADQTKKNVFGANDLVYKGDVSLWIKLANSLRLRMAMRIVYVDPTLARTEAEKAITGGVILANNESANIATGVNSLNGLSTATYLEEWRISTTMHSLLAGYNDPRMRVYMSQAWNGGGYKGLRNGLPVNQRDRAAMTVSYSGVGNRWRPLYTGAWGEAGTNAPMAVISAAEVAFLRAEGALRGWNMGGTASDFYKSGIRFSLSSMTTATTSEIETYINGTSLPIAMNDPWNSPRVADIPVAYQSGGSFETQLEQIITQKWLALFPDGWEAWSERRRTGYPVGYALIESLNPNLTKFQLARRRLFPPIEASSNSEAFKQALTLLGGPDRVDTRLWWDAKPIASYPVPKN